MRVVITTDKHEIGGISEPLDLRENPRAIANIDAARQHPALGGLLVNLNSEESPFSTLGCEVWSSIETAQAEPDVFTSRLDLVIRDEIGISGQSQYEDLARRLAELLEREPGDALRVELHIAPTALSDLRHAYCLRLILCACGKGEQQARLRWTLGIARMQQALLFLARAIRQNR
jgi:hypothetical protein